jgi:hypothetical protein
MTTSTETLQRASAESWIWVFLIEAEKTVIYMLNDRALKNLQQCKATGTRIPTLETASRSAESSSTN